MVYECLARAMSLPQNLHTKARHRLAESVIERCQGQLPTKYEVQVCGVVTSQSVAAAERQNVVERSTRSFLVYLNVEDGKHVRELRCIIRRNPFSLLGYGQDIDNFQEPMRRDNSRFRGKAILNTRSLRRAFVPETPCHRHRAVEDQRGLHLRPSAIKSWTRRPSNRLRLANSRILRIASLRRSMEWAGRAGTNRATGLPCRVIVISSPAATRSRSCENRVLAS